MRAQRNIPAMAIGITAISVILLACHEESAPRAASAQPATAPAPPAYAACMDGPPICSQDTKLVIQCQRGAWVVLQSCASTCAVGPNRMPACTPGGSGACAAEGSYECSADRATLLVCRRGQYAVASTCRGSRGCVSGAAVSCDHSLAAVGDPCDDPGTIACAADRKTMVRCQSGVFAFAESCRNACLSAGGRVLCQ